LVAEGGVSGKLVVESKGNSKDYGTGPVVKDFSCKINRGDRIGISGPNGAGKTTLLNMLLGTLAPDAGTVRLGTNLQTLTLDQKRESLDGVQTLSEVLTGDGSDMVTIGEQRKHVIAYMKDFLFLPEQARTPVSRLSGGERGRLMLARALARPSNLLMLDEPTNDLDLETLDLLQEMLGDYQGTVLLVSHDRDFLDRVVTSIFAAEGDGHWQEYAGGYTDMMRQRRPAPKPVDAPRKGKPVRPEPTATQSRRKLTFKDKHALDTLPGEIEALKAQIATHRKTLTDPELFARKPDLFNATISGLEQTEAALEKNEERWLELEILREELEAG
jgi:ATP-binding cassette subfamily F protein uup